jgi:delta 1-pyrroline-5-carboxylate dehydrogenase
MRVVGKSMVALAVAFMVVGLVGGQQFGGKGGGFGGKGGGNQDAYTLLRNDQVKKELGITEEQVEKIPAAVMQALGTVLDDKQMKRLRQIELQTRGTQAFLDAHVQKELKITPEQSGNIKTILDDSKKEQAEAFKDAQGGGNFGAVQEKLAELRKETNEKVQAVLTSDQRRAYKQLLGEEFKLQFKGFGGKKKNKDI